jgi:hypothetical protein
MKRTINYLLGLVAMFGMVTLISCEGPEGPAGADGGNSCLECHTDAKWDVIKSEFEAHKHGSGTSFAYAGTRSSCAPCHDHDAYITFLKTGALIAGYGMKVECGTCHESHTGLEPGFDVPLREVGDVASMAVDGATYAHGTGNMCATCHQARSTTSTYDIYDVATTDTATISSSDIDYYRGAYIGGTLPGAIDTLWSTDGKYLVVFDIPTTHVFTSSTHAGPHHGPQANVIAADIGSAAGTAFTRHTDCSSCHLNDATADAGYGHNFAPDIAQCDACHSSTDVTAEQDAIQLRLDAVQTALENIHAIHVDDEGIHPLYASLPRAQWNAFWDFMVIYEDNSKGAHNPGYVKQLLTSCENALGL